MLQQRDLSQLHNYYQSCVRQCAYVVQSSNLEFVQWYIVKSNKLASFVNAHFAQRNCATTHTAIRAQYQAVLV